MAYSRCQILNHSSSSFVISEFWSCAGIINYGQGDGRPFQYGAFRVDYLYTADRLDAGYVVTTAGGVEIARHVTRDTWRRHLVSVVSNSVSSIFHSPFSIRHSYSYDALGRPVSRSGDSFAYNARSEVSATTLDGVDASYAYDPAGNRTVFDWDGAASVYTANGLNQYASVVSGGVTNALAYDAWGNLTDTSPFRFTYSYAGNLLVGVDTNRANGVRSYADYDYNAQSRRAYKYVHPPSGPNRSHWYFYSGWSLQTEQWRQGNSGPYNFVHYVWGRDLSGTLDGAGGVGGLLATEVGGVWYFPVYDANGNVTDYVSETGEVVASYSYDAFGRTIAKSGAMADTFPFRFSTKYYDAETGLYYYGYRYYSPELGRWITRDPIEEAGGDNLYAFCGNNGINGVDALGKYLTISTTKDSKGTTVKVSLKISFQLLVCPENFEDFADYHEQVATEIKRRWTQSVVTNGITYSLSFLPGGNAARIGKIGDPKMEQGNYHTFKLVRRRNGTHFGQRMASHVEKIGGMNAEIYVEDHRNLNVYVHEFGHFLGLKDRYDEIDTRKYDINTGLPIVLTPPQAGYKDHIMGDLGAKVSAEEIKILSELTSDKYNLR